MSFGTDFNHLSCLWIFMDDDPVNSYPELQQVKGFGRHSTYINWCAGLFIHPGRRGWMITTRTGKNFMKKWIGVCLRSLLFLIVIKDHSQTRWDRQQVYAGNAKKVTVAQGVW